jgi:hypothetical protein
MTHVFCVFWSCILLTGCANSIFDPVPYDPTYNSTTDQAIHTALDSWSGSIPTFNNLPDAATKLYDMSVGYKDERNYLMRQELIFDVPLIGLTTAAVVNPIFDGAKSATLALGLGAAGVAGTSLYFNPKTRITDYDNAATQLSCAASAALSMSQEQTLDSASIAPGANSNLVDKLNGEITLVAGTMNGTTATTGSNLQTANNKAVISVAALQTAIDSLETAPSTLQSFAIKVVSSTDSNIISNVQNVTSVDTSISNAASTLTQKGKPAPVPPAAPPVGNAPITKAAPPTVSAAELTQALDADSTLADAIILRINSAMALLTKCSSSSPSS